MAAATRRLLDSRQLRAALGLAIVVVAFALVIPEFATYGDVLERLRSIEPSWLVVLGVLGAANLAAPATSQRAALPGLGLGDAVAADWTTSAITNTIPGGSAVAIGITWSMYRSYGLKNGPIGRSVIVTGVWDTFVKFGTPLLALVWLSTERPLTPGLVQAAVVGGALFTIVIGLGAVLLAGPGAAVRIGHVLDVLPFIGKGWPDRFAELRTETVSLLRSRWIGLTFWTVAGHANLYLLFLACLRAVGVTPAEASAAAVLAAFAFGRLITALPVSPGGLGVMEISLTGALAVVGNAAEANVVAAVLLFRFATFALPIPLGAIAWLRWTNSATGPAPSPTDG